jgi:hypothetical protein
MDQNRTVGGGIRSMTDKRLVMDGEPVFTCHKVATRYCYNLSVKEVEAILGEDKERQLSLCGALERIEGISEAYYYYGNFEPPFVFFTVDSGHDDLITHRKIVTVIADYCYKWEHSSAANEFLAELYK